MKYLSLFFLFSIAIHPFVIAQTTPASIKNIGDGIYLMYYDSTAQKKSITKSTIVEFTDYLALIEMPISNDGAGAVNLTDHTEGGENVLQTLRAAFPDKPLKYVLSSHWHPHSISSVIPFISKGITVVTTENNFKRIGEFVDSATFKKYRQYIRFVEEDSLLLQDSFNSIIAYKFSKEDYPSVPTEDFLYFYLPKYNFFHCSCMFQRLRGHLVKGKEMISVRAEDLYRFINSKQIKPVHLIGTDLYWDEADGMVSLDTLQHMMRDGIGMSVLEADIRNASEETLVLKSDSIIKDLFMGNVPTSILNRAVYTTLERKELKQALGLAKIQALLNPADPNSWDTLGEIYYFLGEIEMARHYQRQSRRINKEFKIGGEEVWKKELQDFQKKWDEKGY